MTKNMVKKALKLCASGKFENCVKCPYDSSERRCNLELDALDIITEQEEEIDSLKQQLDWSNTCSQTIMDESTGLSCYRRMRIF